MTTLEARELSCGYGNRQVLDVVSMAMRAGEMLILLGPNGAGKTTLLRALARLLRPQSGKVLLHDKEVWSQSPGEVARQLALMPQSERRDWPLTVEEAIFVGRAPHRGWLLPFNGADRIFVEQALRHAGLWELRSRPITELSGGEWRRVMLARALAQQAQVLLLDEPTAGLDLKYQVEVLGLIRGFAVRQGLTVMITLHD